MWGNSMPFSFSRSSGSGQMSSGNQLQLACEQGQFQPVFQLLNRGFDPNCYDSKMVYPIHIAARTGNTKILEALLEFGADPNSTTANGETPLHFAAMNGHEKAVDILIRAGGDPSIKDASGQLPMNYAEYRGHDSLAQYLLPRSVSKSTTPESIFEMIKEGDKESLLFALQAGISPDYFNGKEYPIHYALRKGKTECALILISGGCDITRRSKGSLPIHIAADRGYNKLLTLLIKKGGYVNDKNTNTGNTPLYFAVSKGNIGAVEILLDNGADPLIGNNTGQTPLQLALLSSRREMFGAMLSHGLLKNVKPEYLLTIAAQTGRGGLALMMSMIVDDFTEVQRMTSILNEKQIKVVEMMSKQNPLKEINVQAASNRYGECLAVLDSL